MQDYHSGTAENTRATPDRAREGDGEKIRFAGASSIRTRIRTYLGGDTQALKRLKRKWQGDLLCSLIDFPAEHTRQESARLSTRRCFVKSQKTP